MLCYGFEKGSTQAIQYGWYNYELVDRDGMKVRDISTGAAKHEISDWAMGNSYLGLPVLNIDKDGVETVSPAAATIEYCKNFNLNILPTVAPASVDGFRVLLDESVSGYKLSVIDEERHIIFNGTQGFEGAKAAMAAAIAKMDAAGGQEVLDFANEAIQEFWARG